MIARKPPTSTDDHLYMLVGSALFVFALVAVAAPAGGWFGGGPTEVEAEIGTVWLVITVTVAALVLRWWWRR